MDVKFICRLQGLIVKDVLPDYLQVFEGKLRGVNVRVGNHIAPGFDKVPTLLKRLLFWYRKNDNQLNPLVVAAHFHCVFEDIHPFVDGNGRTGRLLLNFMLKNKEYPYLNIPFKERAAYYKAPDAFHKTQHCKLMVLLFIKIYMSTLNQYKRSL
jgi:Fic family protein